MLMQILLTVTLLLFPSVAQANTMAPVFPILSGIGWTALPIIVVIEAVYYYKKSTNNPIRLAIYSNLFSAMIGLALAVVTAPLMIGPSVEKHLFLIYAGAFISVGAIALHWYLSSYFEYKFSQWHKLWKESGLKKSLFYIANAITYSLILLLFSIMTVKQLMDYYQ